MAVLAEFTPLMEPISIDEAFLDVTASRALLGDGPTIAAADQGAHPRGRSSSRRRSASPRTSSSPRWPRTSESPTASWSSRRARRRGFLAPLPIARLWGVGKVTAAALEGIGVRTIGQLAAIPEAHLRARFGDSGAAAARARPRARRSARRAVRAAQVDGRRGDLRARSSGRRAAAAPRCAGRRSGWPGSCARRDTRGAR